MKLKNILTEAKAIDVKAAEKIVGDKLHELQLHKGKAPKVMKAIKAAFEKGRGEASFNEDIPVKSLGKMAPMFKSVDLKTTVSTGIQSGNEFVCVITLEYSYKHPSGSNGYRTALMYRSHDKKWQNWG